MHQAPGRRWLQNPPPGTGPPPTVLLPPYRHRVTQGCRRRDRSYHTHASITPFSLLILTLLTLTYLSLNPPYFPYPTSLPQVSSPSAPPLPSPIITPSPSVHSQSSSILSTHQFPLSTPPVILHSISPANTPSPHQASPSHVPSPSSILSTHQTQASTPPVIVHSISPANTPSPHQASPPHVSLPSSTPSASTQVSPPIPTPPTLSTPITLPHSFLFHPQPAHTHTGHEDHDSQQVSTMDNLSCKPLSRDTVNLLSKGLRF